MGSLQIVSSWGKTQTIRYIVNKSLLSKLDKWSDDAGGRHKKSATCLSQLHIHFKKKVSTMLVSDFGTYNKE